MNLDELIACGKWATDCFLVSFAVQIGIETEMPFGWVAANNKFVLNRRYGNNMPGDVIPIFDTDRFVPLSIEALTYLALD